MDRGYECLVYMPHSYDGGGPPESCASVLPSFRESGLATTVLLPRHLKPFSRNVRVVETLGVVTRRIPFRITTWFARNSLDKAFIDALDRADPGRTVAYFWPDVSLRVLHETKRRGILAVRDMVNSPVETAKVILDRAYAAFGVEPRHNASSQKAEHERVELPLYDYFLTENAEVDDALQKLGIAESKLLRSSWGWRPDRFPAKNVERPVELSGRIVALFVGTIGIRKGIPELLDAWQLANVDGVLLLAGAVESEVEALVADHVASGRVKHLGFVQDVNTLYRLADFFVFPTHEEGGPQVTIEAAGCGLPSITTPMGTARFVEDGRNGIVVPPGDRATLAAAISRMSSSEQDRGRMAEHAAVKAQSYTFDVIGAERARMLVQALDRRARAGRAIGELRSG